MALTKAEQEEVEALRKRAAAAEQETKDLLQQQADDAAALAQAEIDKQDAIAAVEAKMREEFSRDINAARAGVNRKDVEVDPNRPPKFNPNAYYGEVHSDGDESYAQAGWFFDYNHKPIRPTNKARINLTTSKAQEAAV